MGHPRAEGERSIDTRRIPILLRDQLFPLEGAASGFAFSVFGQIRAAHFAAVPACRHGQGCPSCPSQRGRACVAGTEELESREYCKQGLYSVSIS